MHQVLLELRDPHATSSATIGLWNAPASTFRWVTAGHHGPLRVTNDGTLERLDGMLLPDLGTKGFPDSIEVNEARILVGERLLLLSDGVTGDLDGDEPGLEGIQRATAKSAGRSAPATLRAIEDLVRETNPEQLKDDATIIILAPSGMTGPDNS